MRIIFLSLTLAVFLAPVGATPHGQKTNFVRVEGGSFMMGGTIFFGACCCYSTEMPVRSVTVSGFYMGRFPVTQGEWYDVMGTRPGYFDGRRNVIRNPVSGVNWRNLPVENVSWFNAVEFANAKSLRAGLAPAYTINGSGANHKVTWNRAANGYRLPTEAEWEFAARGGTVCLGNFKFPGSDVAGEVAWYARNSMGRTHEVGLLKPNALGIYDMGGNVREWMWDWFCPNPDTARIDPVGAPSGLYRVIRGTSWYGSAERARSASRSWISPSGWGPGIGLRLVRQG